jgi:hypothetical protein
MEQNSIDTVYNNMLLLLIDEISNNIPDKSQLSYRLRNIMIFILDHYDHFVNNHKDILEIQITKYYSSSLEIIKSEYNILSNRQIEYELSVTDEKIMNDYKKTIGYMKHFTDKYSLSGVF